MLMKAIYTAFMGVLLFTTPAYADHAEDRRLLNRTAYDLATQAENLAHQAGRFERGIYRAAQTLHLAASELYYVTKADLIPNRNMSLLDHSEPVQAAYQNVTQAYYRLSEVASHHYRYRYSLRRISYTFQVLTGLYQGLEGDDDDDDDSIGRGPHGHFLPAHSNRP